MTATVSTNPSKNVKKFSPPLHNWKENVRGSKKLAIILTVLHMIAAPAVMLALIISIYSNSEYYDIEGIGVIAVIATALAGFLGIFPAVSSFSCLNDKTVVDMRLSLPMTAAQRFVSNFLSGLFTYVAPFLSAQVFSLLFALYGRIFMDGRTFYRIWHDEFNNEIRTPYVCDVFSEALPALLKLIAGGLLTMLMLYTVTVLITTCCGSKFESIAYSVLINILIPATVLCVTYSIFEDLYGVDPYLTAYKVIMYTSTAGGVMAAIDWASSSFGSSLIGFASEGLINYGIWALIYLLVIAALFALTFFLYRKRRAEQVSKPFVFKLVYYITVTCGIFCIVSLALDELGLPATLILTAVLYLIFEVVTNRGFKRIWLSIIKYAFTFLGAWAVIVIGVKTDGFGTVYRVPAAATVTSAEIYYEGFYGDFNEIGNSYSMDIPIVIKDKENIKTIISAHKAAVQDYKDYDFHELYSYGISYAPLTLKYNLIGGGSFYRHYDGLCAEAVEILTALDVSEEYKTQIAEIYKQEILAIPDEYNKTIESYIKDRIPVNERDYAAYTLNRMLTDEDNTKVTVSSLCARGFYEKLADAYYNDIMAINEENYFRSELKNVWSFYTLTNNNGGYTSSPVLTVPESFENTIALLEQFDFNPKRVETVDEQYILDQLIQAASGGYVQLYTESEWRAINYRDEGILHAEWLRISRDKNYECFVYDFDENFIELVRSAMPRNIVSENGYIISVYNFSGAVPEEMNEAAAAVTRTGRDEDTEKLYNEIANGESEQYYD